MASNRLSVFAGGWSLADVEAICAYEGIEQEEVLDLLGRLVSKSLVLAEEAADGAERYRLLETVRQYARERLVAAAEADAVQRRHAIWFLKFAEALHPDELAWRTLVAGGSVLDQLEREWSGCRHSVAMRRHRHVSGEGLRRGHRECIMPYASASSDGRMGAGLSKIDALRGRLNVSETSGST